MKEISRHRLWIAIELSVQIMDKSTVWAVECCDSIEAKKTHFTADWCKYLVIFLGRG